MSARDLIPSSQIPEWTWRHLKLAADRPDHPFHLLVMATVSPEGRPSARVMTVRGVDRGAGRMWFYTRMDTPKVADLRGRDSTCFVGYDPDSGVQLRLAGAAKLHQHDELAAQHWRHLSDVARWLYQLPEEAEAGAVGIDPRLPYDHEKLAAGLTARERAQFGVIEFVIETIDWHQATGAQQCRAVLRGSEGWKCKVVP